MSIINILSPHVADLIAAGEVVERPASVVKELMENSIDAGAKNINVEISRGGMELIRVSDDGCGMSPEDAGIAFMRHATSKLSDERGLESISTLGFRGEALAAISSVSRIKLLTRRRGSDEGVHVELEAGDIQEMCPAGCPEGCVMEIRDLFYNTPARLKFMKSDRAEAGACSLAALKTALAHPEVSIRFIKDGKEEFFTPGDGQARSALYSLLGREVASGMLECSGNDDGIDVSGFISAPHACRGNRGQQFFFINGRPFRSLTVQTALEQAYKNSIMVGRFPACALYINLGFGRVDVNVHPTKSEVKFTEEKKVFDAVYYAALSALSARRDIPSAEIKLPSAPPKPARQTSIKQSAAGGDFFRSMSASDFRTQYAAPRSAGGYPDRREEATGAPRPAPAADPMPERVAPPILGLHSPEPELEPPQMVPRPTIPVITAAQAEASTAAPAPEETDDPVCSATEQGGEQTGLPLEAAPAFRLIGEALNTYIIVETDGKLMLIDKHAAHERMIFDRIRSDGSVMSQSLLLPVTWSPGAETLEIIERNRSTLERLGFETEPYGQDSLIIRAVPADTGGSETALLEELVESLRSGHADSPMDELYHSIACKAAIKAGWDSGREELNSLAEKVVSGQIRYCPHGRPVSVVLTRRELDKFFKRIV